MQYLFSENFGLTYQKNWWVGGFEEILTSADKVGGSKKGKKHADFILECSLSKGKIQFEFLF